MLIFLIILSTFLWLLGMFFLVKTYKKNKVRLVELYAGLRKLASTLSVKIISISIVQECRKLETIGEFWFSASTSVAADDNALSWDDRSSFSDEARALLVFFKRLEPQLLLLKRLKIKYAWIEQIRSKQKS